MVQVEDPSKYGVVVTDEDHRVERFVEKPKVDCRLLLEEYRSFEDVYASCLHTYLHSKPWMVIKKLLKLTHPDHADDMSLE